MILFSIKERINEKWDHVPAADLSGRTVREIFQGYAGRDVVAEFVVTADGEVHRWFFCGNDHWFQRMAEKGRACTFAQAVEILEMRNPKILTQVIPGLDDIIAVFPGCTFELCECGNPVDEPEGEKQ